MKSVDSAKRIDGWTLGVFSAVTLVFLALLGRVAQLQASPPERLAAQMGDRTSTVPEPARRGDILDRRGRVLAATRFGYRVFVDPAEFPAAEAERDLAILALADAVGVPATELGPRLMEKMAENARRLEAAGAGSGDALAGVDVEAAGGARQTALVRYMPVGRVLDDARVDGVKRLKIRGVHLETRPVREHVAEELVGFLVGKVGVEGEGLLAAELVHDDQMQGEAGRFSFVRDSAGRPLWIRPDGYAAPQRGTDLRLSIDLEPQRIVVEELERGVEEADAQGGRAVLLDPHTGEVVALADVTRRAPGVVVYDWTHPIDRGAAVSGQRYEVVKQHAPGTPAALRHNRCVEDVYEPGSTFKPFMWAAATELNLAGPLQVIDTEGGRWSTPYGRALADVVKRDVQTWAEVLINSSNIGMVKVTAQMDFRQMRDAVLKFGFGTTTGIGLPGESPGLVTSARGWSKYTQTSVAIGHEVAVTPVQMARAFSVFARMGERAGTLPAVRLTAATAGEAEGPLVKRVLPSRVAELARETMRGVTRNLDRKLAMKTPPETGWRYELFGKSGTAEIPLGPPPPGKRRLRGSDGYYTGQYNSSFIAGGPVEEPRLVCIVVIDDPGPELVRRRAHYGATVAGPVVRRIMDRSLAYMGVPASPPPSEGVVEHGGD